jgi:hypothetical protein
MAMLPVHVRGPLDRLWDRLHAVVDRLPLARRSEAEPAGGALAPTTASAQLG